MSAQHRRFALMLTLLAAAIPWPAALAPAAAQTATPAVRNWLERQFAANGARRAAAPADAPSEAALSIATWDWLRRVPAIGAEPPLDASARFLATHADWPGTTAIRRRAEAQAADPLKTAANAAFAFFRQLPPQTAAGQARFALVSPGAEGERLAHAAWARPNLPLELESALLARFGPIFGKAEHGARADALLWAGQTTAAGRLLPLLDDENRAFVQARLALRSNAADAEARAASVPARFRRNAGLVYDRVIWLERRNRLKDAEALLAAGDTDTGASSPARWLEKRLAMGRAAMRRGDHRLARQILANHKAYAPETELAALPLSERILLSDTEWLAGWIALRKLNQPEVAAAHFRTFNRAVITPISQTRGDYWLGRAEQARGDTSAANAAFERASRHGDYFYGQLAVEEMGRAPELPMVPRIEVPAAERTRTESLPMARALAVLNDMGDDARASLFVRALAQTPSTPVEARALAEFGQRLKRPDLGVWIWKSARSGNDLSVFDLAYPRLAENAPIPAGSRILSHAIARQESSFDQVAVSSAGARGLMQLMPATAQDVAKRIGLPYSAARLTSDPGYNLQLGSWYIGRRMEDFHNPMLAIAAYNAGAGNVRKWLAMLGDPRAGEDPIDWLEMIPFSETRNYVQEVKKYLEYFRQNRTASL